jgi:hypothetical protein
MAFIRKRGQSYYLVHNVRERGQVRQVHLASLGERPRISDEVIAGVRSKHPFLDVDWDRLRERASRDLVEPFANDSAYLKSLLASIRTLHMDIADLPAPALGLGQDREVLPQVVSSLKLLRSTLDVKLNQLRKGKPIRFGS